MGYSFGKRSRSHLETCHPVLQDIAEAAISATPMDFTILCGYRGEAEQNELYAQGRSKLRYPDSKHNRTDIRGNPMSWAVDVAPWFKEAPHIRWDSPREFRWLAGFFIGIGHSIAVSSGYTLRWGGDWDSDGDHSKVDNPFMDLPHIELVEL